MQNLREKLLGDLQKKFYKQLQLLSHYVYHSNVLHVDDDQDLVHSFVHLLRTQRKDNVQQSKIILYKVVLNILYSVFLKQGM